MTIQPSAHNNRIKYAWYRWRGAGVAGAKRMSQRAKMPPQFYADLERWFFYENGRLIPDPEHGERNKFASRLKDFVFPR